MPKFHRILVTGAEGFVGSHLTEELVRRGYKVRALVLYNSYNNWGWLEKCPQDLLKNIEIVLGDVRDLQSVITAMKNCDAVFHLAALISIPYSYIAPESYIDTNIKGTFNVLQAARQLNIARVINTSTSEVYGTARVVPINEEHPLQGQSPYSASKIAADQIAYSFYTSYGLPVFTVRPFNTYGPRQSARAVIPTIISQIASGEKLIKLGNVNSTRDFNYVSDIVNGFISALEQTSIVGEVVNLGSNFEISIKDTAEIIAQIMGVNVAIAPESFRMRPELSEVNRLWADNTKARKILNWVPLYGNLDGFRRGISETVNWFSAKENLTMYKNQIYNT